MLFSEFLKQIKSGPVQALPLLYIFTGPAKQVLELKEKGLQMLATTLTPLEANTLGTTQLSGVPNLGHRTLLTGLTGAVAGDEAIKRFDMMNFNEPEFWTELYAVPFFNKTRLVLLNIAERMDFIGKIDKQLKEYLSGESLFTRLIIFIDNWTGVSAELSRSVSQKAWIIECRPVSDEDLPRWIAGQLSISHKKISLAGARLLAEKTGNDLAKIDAVLEKLVLFHKDSPTISEESISDFVDTERDFDIRELTNAIIRRQADSALKIAGQLLQKGEPVNKILGFLRTGLAYDAKYQNNNALLLSRYNKLLSADLAIKTGKLTEELALQMLIVRLARPR
jgi:DNA polymerase III delta subunit